MALALAMDLVEGAVCRRVEEQTAHGWKPRVPTTWDREFQRRRHEALRARYAPRPGWQDRFNEQLSGTLKWIEIWLSGTLKWSEIWVSGTPKWCENLKPEKSEKSEYFGTFKS